MHGGTLRAVNRWITGEWAVHYTSARTRRIIHYWATVIWLTVGLVVWILLSDALWFVGFMSLYAIWITHLAGWAAETPVEPEDETLLVDDSTESETLVTREAATS